MVVAGFWAMFCLTAAMLAVAMHSGYRGRRRRHLAAAPVALLCLAGAILLAEQMARARLFPPEPMRIHLVFAKLGVLLVVPVVVTGLLLWRAPRWRRWHRLAVFLFLAGVLAATGTGIWVFSQSVPRA
jgi:hypothetical protein